MGFGLLLTGYLTLLLFKVVPIEIVGFFIIYLALDKLQTQETTFKYAKYASVYMFLESAFGSFGWIARATKLGSNFFSSKSFITLENILYHSGLLVFHLLLYYGIKNIAKNVGYTKAIGRVRFAAIATVIFYIGQLCAAFIPGGEIMTLPLTAYQLLWLFFNIYTFMGCYMMIVTDEMLEKEEQKFNQFLEKNKKFMKDKKKAAKDIADNSRNAHKSNAKKSAGNKQIYKATKKQ